MNSLTDQQRQDLVTSCINLCKAQARLAADEAGLVNEIEDFRQEAVLACCEAAKRWHPDHDSMGWSELRTKFSTFAVLIIRRHLQDILDKHRPHSQAVQPESWDSFADTHGDGEEPTPYAEPDEGTLALLSRLDPAVRLIVRKVVVEGIAPDRVAEQMGMAVKDVKLTLRNAVRTLRKEKAWLKKAALFGLFEGGLSIGDIAAAEDIEAVA